MCSVTSLLGCKENPGESAPISPQVAEDLSVSLVKGINHPSGEVIEEYVSDTGTHKAKVVAGSRSITEYEILIEENEDLSDEINNAAEEIQYFVEHSVGYKLPIVLDSDYQESGHYISIGNTKAFANSEIDESAIPDLHLSGVFIKSDKNNVYLFGGKPHGYNYTSYEFLKHQIGFEAFGNNEYRIESFEKLNVHQFDVLEIPDIDLRIAGYGCVEKNSTVRSRMRFNTSGSEGKVWMGPNDYNWHNSMQYLPYSTFGGSHPGWYSSSKHQLCYTAHGDSGEHQAMIDTLFSRFVNVLDAHPDCSTISITQEDYNEWCNCSACSALKKKYGTDSASVILFCNEISDKLTEYYKEKGIDRHVDILFFAYHKTTNAPVVKSGNEWVPIDQNVVCRDNVCCFYAPISANYQVPFTDAVNTNYKDNMDQWLACTKKLYLWIYGTDFMAYLLPMNNFNSIVENYKFAFRHGAQYIYDQGQWNETSSTGWAWLKCYLQSKLLWDTSLNFNELVQDWFDNWFKAASKPMKALFDRWYTHSTYMYRNYGVGVECFKENFDARLFPKSEIDAYLAYLQEAFESISNMKESEPFLYQKLYNRILLESISYRYIDYKNFKHYYSSEEAEKMWEEFKSDTRKLGVSYYRETQYLSDYFDNI